MGIVNFSIPKGFVIEITKKIKFDNFVETGTYMGETSFWAAKYFDKVYTIEISPEISETTASKPNCPKNIKFLIGDSKDVLGPLVEKLNGRSFFWLDGHWCSGAAGKDSECPLLDELAALSQLKDAVILIDDARCFLGPLPPPHDYEHWPMIDEVICKLKAYFPANFVTIIDDVIICVPNDVRKIVYEYWMNTFESRFPTHYVDPLKTISKRRIIKYLLGFSS